MRSLLLCRLLLCRLLLWRLLLRRLLLLLLLLSLPLLLFLLPTVSKFHRITPTITIIATPATTITATNTTATNTTATTTTSTTTTNHGVIIPEKRINCENLIEM